MDFTRNAQKEFRDAQKNERWMKKYPSEGRYKERASKSYFSAAESKLKSIIHQKINPRFMQGIQKQILQWFDLAEDYALDSKEKTKINEKRRYAILCFHELKIRDKIKGFMVKHGEREVYLGSGIKENIRNLKKKSLSSKELIEFFTGLKKDYQNLYNKAAKWFRHKDAKDLKAKLDKISKALRERKLLESESVLDINKKSGDFYKKIVEKDLTKRKNELEKLYEELGGGGQATQKPLEKRVVNLGIVAISFLLLSVMFASFGVTGYAVLNLSSENSGFFGCISFIIGLIFAFLYSKLKLRK